MKKSTISSQENFASFVFFNNILKEFSGIPFFGTFLGLYREGGMIDGDDDVDFYVHRLHLDSLTAKMGSLGVVLYFQKCCGGDIIFQQFRKRVGSVECVCDVYYFDLVGQYVVEKANFGGDPDNSVSHLKVPKSFIFPLRSKEIGSASVLMPNNPASLVRYLYGRKWNKPLKKDTDYITRVFFGRPVQFQGRVQFFIYRVLRRIFY